jgi:hypothetical protein
MNSSNSMLAVLPDDRPTATLLPTVAAKAIALPPSPISITPTPILLQSRVMAYFQAQRHTPGVVKMHPLRLLTLHSGSWSSYLIPGLGAVALGSLSLVECQQGGINAVDMMLCE